MDYEQLADIILKNIGGEGNISGFTHCATRLRFTLKNENLANEEVLKKTKGVLGIARSGGQFQIIIGPEVPKAFTAIQGKLKGDVSDNNNNVPKQKRKVTDVIFDFVSGIFTPVLPAIIGAGLIKSVLAIAVLLGMNTSGTTYYFLNLIGDAPLYFLPIMLAYTGAKKLGANPFISMSIAAALLHPNYTALIKDAYTLHFSSFLGIPVTLATYSSSVIPVILMVIVLAQFDKLCERILPKMVKFFLKPLLCLLVIAPLTFIVLGPLGFIIGVGISTALNALNTYAGWLVPTVIGTIMPLMVMAGMHYGLVPFMMQSIASEGYETICGPGNLPSNIAQGAASLAIAFKTKNMEMKETASTTGVTAVLGVTEPALFGVTLKFKKVLYCVMIGGGLGGLFAGITGVKTYTFCSPGLLSLAAYIGPDGLNNLIYAIISMAIAFVVTFILVYIWGYHDSDLAEETADAPEKANSNTETVNSVSEEIIQSPADGEAVPLSEVPDPTFAEEMLGKGAAVQPTDGHFYAPVDGVITTLFPTNHAIGLKSDGGAEILIHIGLDTVSLNGRYFTASVKEGQRVKRGDLMMKVDLDGVAGAGLKTITPVIITNTDDYIEIKETSIGNIRHGDSLIQVH